MHSDQSQSDPSRSYRTLALGTRSVAETEVRRSRFLAVVRRVPDEPAARAMIEQLRVTHRDARHHCSAFILGPEPSTERSNDDGEPSGTAGKPMLEVLRGAGAQRCRGGRGAVVRRHQAGHRRAGAGVR